MSNQFLKLRRSAVQGKIPETSSLDLGELAINTYDGQLFLKKSGSQGEIVTVVGSTGSFTGSFIGNGAGLTDIPASGITGLNLSQIATGSVSASVDVADTAFSVISSSVSLLTSYNNGALNHGLDSIAYGPYSHTEGTATFTSAIYSNIVNVDTASNIIQVTSGSFFTVGQDIAYVYYSAGNDNRVWKGTIVGINNNYITASGAPLENVHNSVFWGFNGGGSTLFNLSSGSATVGPGYGGNLAAWMFSHAEGSFNLASGLNSHAEGRKNASIGAHSHVEGSLNVTYGNSSHAEGYGTKAIGSNSHAEGHSTEARGDNSHAEGDNTFASGNSSHAEGIYTKATEAYSHAEGYYTIASAQAAHAEGAYVSASGQYSHAEGQYTTASGVASHAEGISTSAVGLFSHAEGSLTTALGSFSHAEGDRTLANAEYSHAEGDRTIASGSHSHAEGAFSVAIGLYSHAEGSSTSAIGWNSHAEGISTSAVGFYSHAEGGNTLSSGVRSHAEGYHATASGDGSHAEGSFTLASGQNSHAEGTSTKASAPASHAEGAITLASGNYSHAEGYLTTASGESSHAEGLGSVALGSYQHAQGSYNISSSANSAFIIGNGTSSTNRSNLVFASGSTFQISGSLQVTGSSVSLTGGSFSGSGANLYGIPATGITGLNLSQIAIGSVSASVSNTDISASFRVTSGSNTLLNVTKDGFVWIGNGSFVNQGYQLDVQGTSRFANESTFTPQTSSTRVTTITNSGLLYFANGSTINTFGAGAYAYYRATGEGGTNDNFQQAQSFLLRNNSGRMSVANYGGDLYIGSTSNNVVFANASTEFARLLTGTNGHLLMNTTTDIWNSMLTLEGSASYGGQAWLQPRVSNPVMLSISSGLRGNANHSIPQPGVLDSGSGYVPGTYNNVPLVSSTGIGTGSLATFVVGALGGVTSITITYSGYNYAVGDVLTVSNTNLGGSGTGFSYTLPNASTHLNFATAGMQVFNTTDSANYVFANSTIGWQKIVALKNSEFNNTSSLTSAGITTVSQLSTSSYTSCFYNYTVASASNARSGQVMSVWNGSTITYTEVVTTDIGDTNQVIVSSSLSNGFVRLQVSASAGWTFKNISNLL